MVGQPFAAASGILANAQQAGESFPTVAANVQALGEDIWWNTVRSFLSDRGCNSPTAYAAKSLVNLYSLYYHMTSSGGLEEVVKTRRWSQLANSLGLKWHPNMLNDLCKAYITSGLYALEVWDTQKIAIAGQVSVDLLTTPSQTKAFHSPATGTSKHAEGGGGDPPPPPLLLHPPFLLRRLTILSPLLLLA